MTERTRDLFRNEIETIAETIVGALDTSERWSGWTSYEHDEHGRAILNSARTLYKGDLGVLLFLAAGQRTGVFDHSQVIDHMVDQLIMDADAATSLGVPGLSGGLGAWIYGLNRLSDITDRVELSETAKYVIQRMDVDGMTDSDALDILSGRAGLIVALLSVYETHNDQEALNIAHQLGESLLEAAYIDDDGRRTWSTIHEQRSSGFAHGIAGIAYSLYRLGHHTNEHRFDRAATEAIMSENELYDSSKSNWRTEAEPDASYSQYWCYGAPGICLARLGSAQYTNREIVQRDIDRAVDGIRMDVTKDDTLCHGNVSRLVALIELHEHRIADVRRQTLQMAEEVVKRGRKGGYCITTGSMDHLVDPSLFTGLAGVGYGLLSIVDYDSVPSVCQFK